jgi:putative MFS transporter
MVTVNPDAGTWEETPQERLIARLERLPISRLHTLARLVVGCATFFDGYTSLAIASALPVLVPEWGLKPQNIGFIISIGYLGQLTGALCFGWVAERYGRLRATTMTVAIYAVMNIVCVFAWGPVSLAVFRFIQGIGVGGEVPVAATYINEFAGARRRGRFFLLYELIFGVGLVGAGIAGYLAVPVFGWRAMFVIGATPALLLLPLRLLLPESPRWLISKGRLAEAEKVIGGIEQDLERRGTVLPPPAAIVWRPPVVERQAPWRELFTGIYRRRTLMVWVLWLCAYLVNNGMVTWFPTLYTTIYHVPLSTSLAYSFSTPLISLCLGIVCALNIDRVGRRRWFIFALFGGALPLLVLGFLGASSAIEIMVLATCTYSMVQTVTAGLYLYTGELYPTRIRALGTGIATAWLRLGSSIGPLIVGSILTYGSIQYVFFFFAGVLCLGAAICAIFAIETKGRILEDLSP